MEVYNTVMIDENSDNLNIVIDNSLNIQDINNSEIKDTTIKINKFVDKVIENVVDNIIEKTSKTNKTDLMSFNIKKKCSECTICTESISDSSSEPESENYKCTTCSNHVHPICIYNYGIYHEIRDLNSIPCYVCDKGTIRPNNSIGRKLQVIANELRRVPYRDEGNNGLNERLLDISSPRRMRQNMIEHSEYSDYDEDNDEDEDSSEERQRIIDLENKDFCVLVCKGISCYCCCVCTAGILFGYYCYYEYFL